MDDTIYRHAALDALEWTWAGKAAFDAIKALPSAQSEPRWIPCSERLPEKRDWYLGIFKEPDTGWINPIPFVCDYVGHETPITTSDFWILHSIDEPDSYYQGLKCVAWMPLPKPYKEETEQWVY